MMGLNAWSSRSCSGGLTTHSPCPMFGHPQQLGSWSKFRFLVIRTCGVPKIGIPQNGWFIIEHPIKIDDLGVRPWLRKPPNLPRQILFSQQVPGPLGRLCFRAGYYEAFHKRQLKTHGAWESQAQAKKIIGIGDRWEPSLQVPYFLLWDVYTTVWNIW